MKKEIIPLTKEEMVRLIDASMEDDFYYMLFMVAKTTGRRIGELYGNQVKRVIREEKIGKGTAIGIDGKEIPIIKFKKVYQRVPKKWEGGVKVKDIDFEKGIMNVWVLKRKKQAQDETILIKEVMNLIKYYITRRNLKPDDYLFRGKSYSSIQQAVVRYGKKAEINHKVSIHNFRHYMITELKRLGWEHDKIMKLTGHKAITSLNTYDHIVASDIREEALKALKDI